MTELSSVPKPCLGINISPDLRVLTKNDRNSHVAISICEESSLHGSNWQEQPPRAEHNAEHHGRHTPAQAYMDRVFRCEMGPDIPRELHPGDKEARWCFVRHSKESGSILNVTNRFESLMQRNRERGARELPQLPSLVSFMGGMGGGKSTLVRALIMLCSIQGEDGEETFDIPVSGPAEHKRCPTTPIHSGIHLYKDPATSESTVPIIFAEFEGFNAGAEPWIFACESTRRDEDLLDTILITPSLYSSTGPTPENLYSRFLCSFSDVVCLVPAKPEELAKDIASLLLSMARGHGAPLSRVKKTSTLIIVINALSYEHDLASMGEDELRQKIFAEVPKDLECSEELKRNQQELYTALGGSRRQITNTEDFILHYFRSVSVCYIPPKLHGDPNLLHARSDALRRRIVDNVKQMAEDRATGWTQFRTRDLTRLFSQAFKHFATNPTPFNLYKSSRRDMPQEDIMTEHITNLLRHCTRDGGTEMTEGFPKIVASSILSNCFRGTGLVLDPHLLWENGYKQKCLTAIQDFYEDGVCQYRQGNDYYTIGMSVHGDQYRTGREGEDSSDGTHRFAHPCIEANSSDLERHYTSVTEKIREEFYKQYLELCRDGNVTQWPSADDIATNRKQVLSSLGELWVGVSSYKTCFSCLSSVPDHVLPCGHAQCENCVLDFGEHSETKEAEIVLRGCVFCPRLREEHLVQTKVIGAGVRVLTLDGGGVRGILELEILSKIQERIGLDLAFYDLFDLVVGTSTGGIIALGLFCQGEELKPMIQKFKDISKRTFKYTRGLTVMTRIWNSIYSTTPLGAGLQEVIGKDFSPFGQVVRTKVQRPTRVAVMTVKNDGALATAIANYNRPVLGQEDFERAENEETEIKTWEAGLCTAAAPFYFSPFKRVSQGTTTRYFDGALKHNNPIFWASDEYRKIWYNSRRKDPDILVSVGTGIFPNHRWKLRIPDHVTAIANTFLDNMSGEKIWERFKRNERYNAEIHHRINVRFEGRRCALDKYKEMERLVQEFNAKFQGICPSTEQSQAYSPRILRGSVDQISCLLIAKLFFFQPTKITVDRRNHRDIHTAQGKILCRLRQGTNALKVLVSRIEMFRLCESPTHSEPTSSGSITGPCLVKVACATRQGARFEMPFSITTTDTKSKYSIILSLKRYSKSSLSLEKPISCFPCDFDDLRWAMEEQKRRHRTG